MRNSLKILLGLILFAVSIACYSYLNLTEFATLESLSASPDFSDIKVSKFLVETLQKVAIVTFH